MTDKAQTLQTMESSGKGWTDKEKVRVLLT
jgi:hypothetical protein